MKVALLTNGPGELWGWARPVIMELRKREHSVSLWLLPCQFASGYERTAASRLGVDKLEGPSGGAWTWHALAQEKTDCVLQLGGDLLFGRRLAGCSKAPLLCYAYGFKQGMEHARVFTAYPGMAEGIDANLRGSSGASVIGDLVKDSLALERNSDPNATNPAAFKGDGGPRLLLLPGSRPAIRHLALRWFHTITRRLRAAVPEARVAALFSPFVPEDEFSVWAEAGLNPIRIDSGTAMRASDYALTQPGTNTLEMMHCGLPALVAAPLDFLKAVPVSGLGGAVSGIPLVGPMLKKQAILRKLERGNGFVSWPNRIANRMILDEAAGDVTPGDLAERAIASLTDGSKLLRVRDELLKLSGEEGAVLKLCDAVERAAGKKGS